MNWLVPKVELNPSKSETKNSSLYVYQKKYGLPKIANITNKKTIEIDKIKKCEGFFEFGSAVLSVDLSFGGSLIDLEFEKYIFLDNRIM